MKKFYGKYRGKVVSNLDPLQLGRIQVAVAAVPGISNWAMPCVPYAGMQAGIYAIPQIGTNVWIEFEAGDPDHPIWAGCFWGGATAVPPDLPPAEAVGMVATIPHIAMYTTPLNGVLISSVPAMGIKLQTVSGAMIMISDAGIVLSNGKGATVSLVGKTIDFNLGALTILN